MNTGGIFRRKMHFCLGNLQEYSCPFYSRQALNWVFLMVVQIFSG